MVVYGNEWEDILYFTDLDKAKTRLVIQTLHALRQKHPMYFLPLMYELQEDNGSLYKSEYYWYLNCDDYDKIQNPIEAFPYIKLNS